MVKKTFEIHVGQRYLYNGCTYSTPKNPDDLTHGEVVEVLNATNPTEIRIKNGHEREFIVPSWVLDRLPT